jgi:hypothetical protein
MTFGSTAKSVVIVTIVVVVDPIEHIPKEFNF